MMQNKDKFRLSTQNNSGRILIVGEYYGGYICISDNTIYILF